MKPRSDVSTHPLFRLAVSTWKSHSNSPVFAGLGQARGAAFVLLPLAVDTLFVLFFWHGASPFWFDAMGSGTLMACTIADGMSREKPDHRVALA